MDRAWLERYEEDERNRAVARTRGLPRRSHIASASDLYPDLDLSRSLGYAADAVPLALLILLYERVVVYVPPAAPDTLEARWQIDLDQMLRLIEAGLVQPLIGHPPDYVAPHFARLLEHAPPSVWARGVGLLHDLGLEDSLDPAKCPFPLEQMKLLPAARAKYRRHFPAVDEDELSAMIEREILTHQADLWIFGEQDVAEAIARYRDPDRCFSALLAANQIRTYPTLFGLGGTPNYDLSTLRRDRDVFEPFVDRMKVESIATVPPELEILLRGIGLEAAALTAERLIEFHASGDAAKLRGVVADFEAAGRRARESEEPGTALDSCFTAAERLQSELRAVNRALADPRIRQALARSAHGARYKIKAGVPAIGGLLGIILGGPLAGTAGFGFGSALVQLIPDHVQDRAVERAVSRRFSPGLAHLWSIGVRQQR